MEGSGVIEKSETSEWLGTIVITTKANTSDIRLCIDLRDLNKSIEVDRHTLPRINEMLSLIKNATIFSKLDLSSAYHQVALCPKSKHLTAFTTPFGTYRFCRMPFGLASAASVFQRVMQSVLNGSKNTLCFQDDILIFAKDVNEHN